MTATRTASDRLPRGAAPHNRGRDIRLAVAAVLGLAILLIGIPAALVTFVGYPLPRTAPSRAWLTQPLTATLMVKVLACLVWAAWAHFAVCVLSEWRALRDGRLPKNVVLGGGSQALARRLVAAALLLSGTAAAFAPTATATVSTVVHQSPSSVVAASSPRQDTPRTAAVPSPQAPGARKYYVVKPPAGRRYDSLWDIAHRTLGDPLRYKEIFALNKERVQPDGRTLVDANLIHPGWELHLPADASGPDVHVLHAAPARPVPHEPTEPVAHPHGSSVIADEPVAQARGDQLDVRVLGGGLILAGLLTALAARRGPYAGGSEAEEALTTVADFALAASLEQALRQLGAARIEQGRAVPNVVLAWATADEISLTLAGGDTTEPPSPWRSDHDGHAWTVRCDELPTHNDGPVPFPGLVSVGRESGHEVFVDLEHAPGLIALSGHLEQARDVAAMLAVQAATSAWGEDTAVTLVGFGNGDEIARLAPRRITAVPHVGPVLDELESERARTAALLGRLGIDDVLTGRQTARTSGTEWRPHIVVLSGVPGPQETSRLHDIVGAARSRFVVIIVGDVASARWRFVIDAAGRIDLGVLGASAMAHRLDRSGISAFGALLEEARRAKHEQDVLARTITPHDAVVTAAPRSSGEPVASVTLLGPVDVEAGGPVDAAQRALLTEVIVAIALHQDGVHEAVLRASIWPRGVGDDVVAATMADAARWLGQGAGGAVLTCVDGRWRLSDDVAVDWDSLRFLASKAAGTREADTLLEAVRLLRGPLFSATPPGRYRWLTFGKAASQARMLATAVVRRAAALEASSGRVAEAEEVLRTGLTAVPTAEVLWRDLLTLLAPDAPEAAISAVEQMYSTLASNHLTPEPETDALAARLSPGRTSTAAREPAAIRATG